MQRVLIIEDDARVRAALTALIAGAGDLTVVAAVGTAAAARTALTGRQADIILLDVQLPHRGDGIALIRALSRRYPVIALSIDGTSRAPALRAGATAYLEKTENPDDILQALANHGHRQSSGPEPGSTDMKPPQWSAVSLPL